LDGDFQYNVEGHGPQDCHKGIIFESFPPVLRLSLNRFDYNLDQKAMVKLTDRHEYPPTIDLAEFLDPSVDRSESWVYSLHAVVAHKGGVAGGNYTVMIKQRCHSKWEWLSFDDDVVTPVTAMEVFEKNFGKAQPNHQSSTAYVLVYMRDSLLDEILPDVTDDDIPQHLSKLTVTLRRSRLIFVW
jgi:ubiquitin carboxyl-terminal hydrolase 7